MKKIVKILLFPITLAVGLASIFLVSPRGVCRQIESFAANADRDQAFLFRQYFGPHFVQGQFNVSAVLPEVTLSIPCVGVYENLKADLLDFCERNSLETEIVPTQEGWEFLEINVGASGSDMQLILRGIVRRLGINRFSLFRLVML